MEDYVWNEREHQKALFSDVSLEEIEKYSISRMPGDSKFQPPKVPFVNTDALKRNIFALPFYYIVKKATEGYRADIREKKEKGITPKSILGDLLGITIENFSQHFDVLFLETFPKIKTWEKYKEGATKIERLFTVEFMGYELPVYACDIDDPEPTTDMLKKAVTTVKQTYKSPLNGEEAAEFFRGPFSQAANKITRGDYGRIIDPIRFNKWFSRMEMYMIQQNDPKEKEYRITLDNGESFTIRMYRKRRDRSLLESLTNTRGRVFRYILEDKIYDLIDWFFDPIQEKIMEWESSGFIPEGYTQALVKREYKVISRFVRDIYRNPSRPPLEFDLTPILLAPNYN
ncbi:MAG: hypothetical protein DRP16_02205 [Candidatus Aenigmatarchaeota archaeon]|nr:MAG: hypothetical protein DRP16_02205 [Candidatus Aenigmarchaeota archaeon]